MARCSICRTLVQPSDETTSCDECGQTYHQSCWDGIGGCATYGCAAAAQAEKPPPPPVVGAGWGDTKTCPVCATEIASSLLVCRCGARFPYADPLSPAEYQGWLYDERQRSSSRKTLLGLFAGSLLGFPAPPLGAIAGWLAHRNRDELGGENGAYLALGYGTAVLGAAYSLVFLLLVLGA